LGGRKGIRPVKNEWWGAGVVVCLEQGADLHMAQLMPLPLTVSCFSEIQIGFTFLVPAYLDSPRKRAVKRVCVCVLVCVLLAYTFTLVPRCIVLCRYVMYTGSPFDPVEIESKLEEVNAKSVREACMAYIYDKCPAIVGYGEFLSVAFYIPASNKLYQN